ncbi:hypothetical protein F5B22DRAFT_160355 [Xylaria bambusicola]|uniref:uncharacterized protein n=1 Tax=Xylaria bambusicola TaxID=326684 RepID=UPI00200836CA|nr:uncharacterized protein F5B22DRAFT_160355 [Xylaria bambusicola]KAI0526481.1 hypothetical protein F5B22DRAFT_160355 [Xylaria bambusicola]
MVISSTRAVPHLLVLLVRGLLGCYTYRYLGYRYTQGIQDITYTTVQIGRYPSTRQLLFSSSVIGHRQLCCDGGDIVDRHIQIKTKM